MCTTWACTVALSTAIAHVHVQISVRAGSLSRQTVTPIESSGWNASTFDHSCLCFKMAPAKRPRTDIEPDIVANALRPH
eukprot:10182602-Alexandrium_andersonii.AAC.1